MEQRINRVNEAVQMWNQSEKEHAALYPEIMDKPSFARARLRELNIIEARFRNTRDASERKSLRFLKIEVKQLKKKALGDKFNWRHIAYFLIKPFIVDRIAVRINHKEDQKKADFISTLIRSPFRDYANDVMTLIKQGKKKFSFSVPFQNNDNEVTNFKLNIGYDSDGGHNFKNVEASYVNKRNPADNRQHIFPPIINGLDQQDMAKLMAGKAIHQKGYGWSQLQITDKGDFQLKKLSTLDFDVDNACKELPIWNKLSRNQKTLCVLSLKSGNSARVSFDLNGVRTTLQLEASPFTNKILPFSENGKPVDLNKMMAAGQKLQTLHTNMHIVKAASLSEKNSRQNLKEKPKVEHRVKLRSSKVMR